MAREHGVVGTARPATAVRTAAALVLAIAAAGAAGSDVAKERRWADQIADALLDGVAVYLDDGAGEFLAIDTPPPGGDARAGVIVMHGIGAHPNWQTVVQPLRVALADRGFHTLSIQMPILANEAAAEDYEALFPEVPGRIDAAAAYLRAAGAGRVFLVAHSMGASMTVYYLRDGAAPVDGVVTVGLGPGQAGTHRDTLAQLPGVSVPMLDLYGGEDLEAVVASAAQRAAAAAANPAYVQVMSPGADHFFDGEEDALIEAVAGWLDARVR